MFHPPAVLNKNKNVFLLKCDDSVLMRKISLFYLIPHFHIEDLEIENRGGKLLRVKKEKNSFRAFVERIEFRKVSSSSKLMHYSSYFSGQKSSSNTAFHPSTLFLLSDLTRLSILPTSKALSRDTSAWCKWGRARSLVRI